MWSRRFHLRRTKFILYQLAMILSLVSESLGTAVLDKINVQQKRLQKLHPTASLVTKDLRAALILNIAFGVTAATVLGTAFFMDLFFPTRHEPRWIRLLWRVAIVITILIGLADAVTFTAVLPYGRAKIRGFDRNDDVVAILKEVGGPALIYRRELRTVIAFSLLWPAWIFAVASAWVMIKSQRHDDLEGPYAKGYGPESDTEIKDAAAASGRQDSDKETVSV